MKTTSLEFKWSVSRGRDTYGYAICTLYANGDRVARCNGGGYDMKGTCLGSFIAKAYADRLLNLSPEEMPENSHWESERARVCVGACADTYQTALMAAVESGDVERFKASVSMEKLPEDCFTCPACGGDTRQSRDGKRVNDGRYFYGLSFHNPNFDPGKVVIGEGCQDRTLGKGAEGKTVEAAEAEGESFGLERYQAFYKASSKQPSKLHRVPLIDGACGFSSVESIMKAIGLSLEWHKVRGSKLELYTLHDAGMLAAVEI